MDNRVRKNAAIPGKVYDMMYLKKCLINRLKLSPLYWYKTMAQLRAVDSAALPGELRTFCTASSVSRLPAGRSADVITRLAPLMFRGSALSVIRGRRMCAWGRHICAKTKDRREMRRKILHSDQNLGETADMNITDKRGGESRRGRDGGVKQPRGPEAQRRGERGEGGGGLMTPQITLLISPNPHTHAARHTPTSRCLKLRNQTV